MQGTLSCEGGGRRAVGPNLVRGQKQLENIVLCAQRRSLHLPAKTETQARYLVTGTAVGLLSGPQSLEMALIKPCKLQVGVLAPL